MYQEKARAREEVLLHYREVLERSAREKVTKREVLLSSEIESEFDLNQVTVES